MSIPVKVGIVWFRPVPSPRKFPNGLGYTLSRIKLVKLSFASRNHLVSEPSPYSYHSEVRGLAADYPILHVFTIGFVN